VPTPLPPFGAASDGQYVVFGYGLYPLAGEIRTVRSGVLEALCEFVRVHFDKLLDRYYLERHESLNEFPAWAFERYLRR
jgi:hypothetical protein